MVKNNYWKHSFYNKEKTNIQSYTNYVNNFFVKKRIKNYQELWEWSVNKTSDFWTSIYKYYLEENQKLFNVFDYNNNKPFFEAKWFKGTVIKPYSYYILRNLFSKRIKKQDIAIIYKSEKTEKKSISWGELYDYVKKAQKYLISKGVSKGSRVAAVLNNGPEAVIYFLATNSLGAIWSSCSPDFGSPSIMERFKQIKPDLLIITDRYYYNGKTYDKKTLIQDLKQNLKTLKATLVITENTLKELKKENLSVGDIIFQDIEFNDPIWVLYSSGTTGKPKAITHSNGGMVLEHYKALGLHQECVKKDKFFWFSTTGWMMWNYSIGSMLHGCTLVLYDGSPNYPTINVLWDYVIEADINHFGGGASYFIACLKKDLKLKNNFKNLKSIGSTGSPLTEEAFIWLRENIKKNLWLISLSGGTDVCTAFVGGCAEKRIYIGEIQCRMLGAKVEVYNSLKESVEKEIGEMVITKPMPCMPVFFWNDKKNIRYKKSYFEEYDNVWRHGDWMKITKNHGVIIYGRSDATLNKGGVRLGTSEIYKNIEFLEEVEDSIIVCLDLESGKQFMPLFIKTKKSLSVELKNKIKEVLRKNCSPRHVPDEIYKISDIPYTISGKKMETPIKKILMGSNLNNSISKDAMKNPEIIDFFVKFKEKELTRRLKAK